MLSTSLLHWECNRRHTESRFRSAGKLASPQSAHAVLTTMPFVACLHSQSMLLAFIHVGVHMASYTSVLS